MPGKPYRHKLLESFQPPDPASPLTPEQLIHFQRWLIEALLFRLSNKSEKEARAARAGIKLSFRWVKVLHDMPNCSDEKAFGMASSIVAKWPEKKILATFTSLDHRNPVALFTESNSLLEKIESLPNNNAKQNWLRSMNEFSERELEKLFGARAAEILETVLAKRHGTNKGKIHKLLAEASALFRHHNSSRRTSR